MADLSLAIADGLFATASKAGYDPHVLVLWVSGLRRVMP